MAYWEYWQVEVLGRPMSPRDVTLLERALLVFDGDAPVAGSDRRDRDYPPLDGWGYEGAWRSPSLSVTEVLSLVRALGYEARGRAVKSVVYNDYTGTDEDDRRLVEGVRWVTSWAAPDDRLDWVTTRYRRWGQRGAHAQVVRDRAALAGVSRRFARLLPPAPPSPLPEGSRNARRRARAKERA